MKQASLLILLLVGLLSWSGCGDDDDQDANPVLTYAGPQFAAPALPVGYNEFAAYFPGNLTEEFAGRVLERVEFDLVDIPSALWVVVYDAGATGDEPGQLLYEADITNRASTGRMSHRLPNPIEITGQGIWIAIGVELAANGAQSVGCDQGRNYNVNGDRLFLADIRRWTNFQDRTGGAERVNWNISGVLSEE